MSATARRPSAHAEPSSRAQRVERGKAARARCRAPRHAAWSRRRSRRDPVDLLEEQAQTRVPELVPIRYGRMLVLAVHVLPGRGVR